MMAVRDVSRMSGAEKPFVSDASHQTRFDGIYGVGGH